MSKGWNPKGCIIEIAKRKRGPRKWMPFKNFGPTPVLFSMRDAVAAIRRFRKVLPDFAFRIRVT